MKIKIIRLIMLILITLNCSTIFVFSSEISDDSSSRSGMVVNFLAEIIPDIKNMPENEKEIFKAEVMQPVVRKIAHYTIYTTLGILTMSFALTCKGTKYQKGLSATLFGLLYSISDETHQSFVPGRSCELRDVCIDTIGVITGVLIACLIYGIYKKVTKKQEEKKEINKDTKILFISSTGGHFSELMRLKPLMEKCNYHIVTEKTKSNEDLKKKYKEKIDYLVYETKKRPFKYAFVLLANSFISLFIYLKFRPQVIVTTGTHTAGPMCCIARILGSKVIYIETYANRTSKTSAGKLLYYVANVFVVQWEEMLKLYPKAKYFGGIY